MNPRRHPDRGSVAVLVAVAMFALLATFGLSYDLSRKMHAIERADDVATEAGRAGAQAIDAGQAISGGRKVIDRTAAVAAARSYLDAAGVSGTVSVAADRRHITVTVTVEYPTAFLQVIGVDRLTATRSVTTVLIAT